VICRTLKPLPSAALALAFACPAAYAQDAHRRHAETAVRAESASSAPVVFLDSTREQDGLKGPVRRVETEIVKVEQRGGATVEKSRSVLERTLYDERGRRAQNETYPVVAHAAGREFHSYDAQGNLAETVVRDARGAVLSRTEYRYLFDSFGNWMKMTASLAVLSAGKLTYEPVEITNRSITYYATGEADGSGPAGDAAARAAMAGGTAKTPDTARAGGAHAQSPVPAARGEAARAAGGAKREGARVAHAAGREIEVGVLNDRATSLPRPAFRVAGRRLERPVTVSVEVVVDQTGLVAEASAPDAPPALRQAAEDAARRTTFFPFYSEGRPVRARGRLNFGFYFAP
jgi:hypothetical protein